MPEVWVELAELTGIDALRRTTRDEPDYDALMQYRLGVLAEHGIGMSNLVPVLTEIRPLDGARAFLDALRADYQVLLLSDTFEEFANEMMPHLGLPTIFCHRLVTQGDEITGYALRCDDHKRRTVEALQGLNYHVAAAGDSFNDLSMLNQANAGALFHAPSAIVDANPQLASFGDFAGLRSWIDLQN